MPAYVWHDIIRAELDRAYDFYVDQLDRSSPQPADPVVKESLTVDEPVKVSSDDERAAQGLPPYNPRHLTEEEWNRLTENGRRAWGNHSADPTNKHSLSVSEPEKEPPCET